MDKFTTYSMSQRQRCAVELLLEKPAITDESRPAHLASLQVQACVDTWSQVKAILSVARATDGSRPGSSLADVIFGARFVKALTDIQNRMREHRVHQNLKEFKRANV